MQMLKYKLYNMSDKTITFDEFSNALTRMAEVTTILKAFETKEEAVRYLMQGSGASFEECAGAYDFYIKMFKTD